MAVEDEMSSKDQTEEFDTAGGKQKMLLIIIVLILLLAGGAAYFVMSQPKGEAVEEAISEEEANRALFERDMSEDLPKIKLQEPAFTEPITFDINLRDGENLMTITVTFKLKNIISRDLFEQRILMAQDMIIGRLQDRSREDLQSKMSIELFKLEVLKMVNNAQFFDEETLKNIEENDMPGPVFDVLITKLNFRYNPVINY
ncbi:MAG: flagellar basal body-associated FliL family protein [SAR324 cluster bacterium]|nr:flagellar basal body-associated FliL family protein [SAR324 cluster bacterium]